MAKPTQERLHLYQTRAELIWALEEHGYSGEEISFMFNRDRGVISKILKSKPRKLPIKWHKRSYKVSVNNKKKEKTNN